MVAIFCDQFLLLLLLLHRRFKFCDRAHVTTACIPRLTSQRPPSSTMHYARELCDWVRDRVSHLIRRLKDAFDPSLHITKNTMVSLDSVFCGTQVTISNFTIGGVGAVIADAGLHQGRAYWEIKVVDFPDEARLGAGVCKKELPESGYYNSALLSSADGTAWTQVFGEQGVQVKPGDLIGVAYDQSDLPLLAFFVNGNKAAEILVRGRGSLLFPVFCVSGGAKVHLNFGPEKFDSTAVPTGFSGIIKAVDLV